METSVPVFVGLDYHQDEVQVCAMNAAGEVQFNEGCQNDRREIVRLVGQSGAHVRVSIEACCGAAHLAEELMQHAGWVVTLAHPGIVTRMKQNPDKTDLTDAHILADLMRLGYLPRVWLAPEEIRELRTVVRYRGQLVAERTRIKLRVRGLLREHRLKPPCGVNAWTVRWLAWLRSTTELGPQSRWVLGQHLDRLEVLSSQIHQVQRRLEQLTAEDAVVARLRTLPGIGPITAVTLRAEIARFERFQNGKQLSRFCGLSPRNASSGQHQAAAGLIKTGNPQLRAVIIEAAHRLIRYDTRWGRLAQRLGQRGKSGSVTAAAVANRWMRWLYHQMQPERLVGA